MKKVRKPADSLDSPSTLPMKSNFQLTSWSKGLVQVEAGGTSLCIDDRNIGKGAEVVLGMWTCCQSVDPRAPACQTFKNHTKKCSKCTQCGVFYRINDSNQQICRYHSDPEPMMLSAYGSVVWNCCRTFGLRNTKYCLDRTGENNIREGCVVGKHKPEFPLITELMMCTNCGETDTNGKGLTATCRRHPGLFCLYRRIRKITYEEIPTRIHIPPKLWKSKRILELIHDSKFIRTIPIVKPPRIKRISVTGGISPPFDFQNISQPLEAIDTDDNIYLHWVPENLVPVLPPRSFRRRKTGHHFVFDQHCCMLSSCPVLHFYEQVIPSPIHQINNVIILSTKHEILFDNEGMAPPQLPYNFIPDLFVPSQLPREVSVVQIVRAFIPERNPTLTSFQDFSQPPTTTPCALSLLLPENQSLCSEYFEQTPPSIIDPVVNISSQPVELEVGCFLEQMAQPALSSNFIPNLPLQLSDIQASNFTQTSSKIQAVCEDNHCHVAVSQSSCSINPLHILRKSTWLSIVELESEPNFMVNEHVQVLKFDIDEFPSPSPTCPSAPKIVRMRTELGISFQNLLYSQCPCVEELYAPLPINTSASLPAVNRMTVELEYQKQNAPLALREQNLFTVFPFPVWDTRYDEKETSLNHFTEHLQKQQLCVPLPTPITKPLPIVLRMTTELKICQEGTAIPCFLPNVCPPSAPVPVQTVDPLINIFIKRCEFKPQPNDAEISLPVIPPNLLHILDHPPKKLCVSAHLRNILRIKSNTFLATADVPNSKFLQAKQKNTAYKVFPTCDFNCLRKADRNRTLQVFNSSLRPITVNPNTHFSEAPNFLVFDRKYAQGYQLKSAIRFSSQTYQGVELVPSLEGPFYSPEQHMPLRHLPETLVGVYRENVSVCTSQYSSKELSSDKFVPVVSQPKLKFCHLEHIIRLDGANETALRNIGKHLLGIDQKWKLAERWRNVHRKSQLYS